MSDEGKLDGTTSWAATGWMVVMDCSMVDSESPGGIGTEGSAVLGM